MKTKLNQFIPNTKTILREKYLEKHPFAHKLTTSLYLKYCRVNGPLHVLPDYYIIGVVKGGTTSLHDYLIKHPCIQPPIGKEIDYFGQLYYRGQYWYRSSFPYKIQKFFAQKIQKKDFLTGEATPRYIEHPNVPERIKQLTPNAKFIVLLRNPIDRAYSHHNMNMTRKHETLSFEEAINNEQSRIQGEYEKMKKDYQYFNWTYYLFAYKEHGKYIERLQRWMKIFPRKQFKIIKSEDLFEKPSTVYAEILEFLNLPKWDLNEYPALKKRKYQKLNMNPETRKKLSEYFKPYNEKLSKFLDINFGWD